MARKRNDLTGREFGFFTVKEIDEAKTKNTRRTYWVCECKCGNTVSVLASNLVTGDSTNCGCLRKNHLQGKKFGNLLILDRDYEFMQTRNDYKTYWKCLCDCGNCFTAREDGILSGRIRSCGCSRKHNTYKLVNDEYYIIYDINDCYFLIDKEDYDIVKNYTWLINSDGYAMSHQDDANVLLHRFLMNADKDDEIDHKNGVRYDCRKSNLRFCTRTQNTWNTGIRSNNTSGVKGVSYNKARDKWFAYINVDKQRKSLGYYTDFNDAVNARLNAERKYFQNWSIYQREPCIINDDQ